MRDFARIQKFTLTMEMLWLAYPDLRFGQLSQVISRDFNQEDEISLDKIKNMLNEIQGKVIVQMGKNGLPINSLTEDGINLFAWLQHCFSETLPEIRSSSVNYTYDIPTKKLVVGSLAGYSQHTINYIATIMEIFNSVK